MSTQEPMLLKEDRLSWLVLDATPMELGLEAGDWEQLSAPYLLPAEVTTGMPAAMSCSAASFRAVERGPAERGRAGGSSQAPQ